MIVFHIKAEIIDEDTHKPNITGWCVSPHVQFKPGTTQGCLQAGVRSVLNHIED